MVDLSISGYIPSSNQNRTVMQTDALLHYAVPAFPAPFSNSNEDSLWSYEENELNGNDIYQDFGGAQTVPVLNTKLKKSTQNNSVRSGKKIGATPCKDPSKMFSGHIRLQSILFARNIAQLASTTALAGKRSSHYALVEIIGTLVAPLKYIDHCWQFVARDPTSQDVSPMYGVNKPHYFGSGTPAIPLPEVLKSPTLHCRLYEIDSSLDQDTFELGEIVKLVGIPLPCLEDGPYSSELRFNLLCVAARRATWDEIEHTLKGAYRGLGPKQA
ncbi:hypothetical protein BGZ91_005796 [Linnemannia elongata]|nr:hypothetical protein BGZ91_005796 [Linnemannia elongata]